MHHYQPIGLGESNGRFPPNFLDTDSTAAPIPFPKRHYSIGASFCTWSDDPHSGLMPHAFTGVHQDQVRVRNVRNRPVNRFPRSTAASRQVSTLMDPSQTRFLQVSDCRQPSFPRHRANPSHSLVFAVAHRQGHRNLPPCT